MSHADALSLSLSVTGLNLGRLQYRTPIHDPEANKVRLTGLSPDMYYRVYLSAATAQGSGEQIFLDMKTTPSEREFTIFISGIVRVHVTAAASSSFANEQ